MNNVPPVVWLLLGSALLGMVYFQTIATRTVSALQEENDRLRAIIAKRFNELSSPEWNDVADIIRQDHE